jgi:hypothetical protein
MPAKQRGTVEKLPSGLWSARYRDADGTRRRAGMAFKIAPHQSENDCPRLHLEGSPSSSRPHLEVTRNLRPILPMVLVDRAAISEAAILASESVVLTIPWRPCGCSCGSGILA